MEIQSCYEIQNQVKLGVAVVDCPYLYQYTTKLY